jgi:hypothetical protein
MALNGIEIDTRANSRVVCGVEHVMQEGTGLICPFVVGYEIYRGVWSVDYDWVVVGKYLSSRED